MQHNTLYIICFLLNCRVIQAQLEWNDFTNNFATDLAPLITLFGEQVTKQFLSESLTIWDNIIFAMAPLGLLTAVVSVIRVCGSASLRAFIGRAQEGSGVAEVELLSCTSETTAEIYNEGGFARVFGEPQILEVVVVKSKDPSDPYRDEPRISMLWDANFKGPETAGYRQINEHGEYPTMNMEKRISRYHRPNLSLNAGIVRLPKGVTYLAAAVGVTLQTGVLIFAALTVYRFAGSFLTAGFGGEDRPAENYSFILTLIGTLAVTFGLFLCAFIIERSSNEVHFRRNDQVDGKIYWIQPGGQNIGDQVFGSYIGSFDGPDYVVSTKSTHRNSTLLWIAVASSIFGFVAQFVGLRGMHASVTLAQIGSTLLMSIIRSMLRMRRLDKSGDVISSLALPDLDRDSPDQHPIIKDPKLLYGHELDLFTMRVHGVDGVFVSMDPDSKFQRALQIQFQTKRHIGKLLLDARSRLAEYTGMPGIRAFGTSAYILETFLWKDLQARDAAYSLQSGLEAAFEAISKVRPIITGSRPHEEDDWSINLSTTDGKNQEQGSTYRVNLQFGKGVSTAYKMPQSPQQLESVLGLWALTLKGYDAGQYHSYSFVSGTRSSDSLRAVFITETHENEEKKLLEKVWSHWMTGRFNLQHGIMDRKRNGFVSNWSGRPGFEHHIFGILSSLPDGHQVRVSFVHTDHSILQMCSQDLFMLFLRSILRNIASIGGKTSLRINKPSLQFENSTVESLVEGFEKAQLGSREDGYICVFTVLMNLRLMPGPKDLVRAVSDAISLDSEENIDIRQRLLDVEELLQSMGDHPSIAGCETNGISAALGELYTAAAKNPSLDVSKFGFDGLVKLLQNDPKSQIAQEYGWIGQETAIRTGMSSYKDILQKAGLAQQAVEDRLSEPNSLVKLAKANNYRLMKYLPGTIDPDVQDDEGMTALCWAAQNKNYSMAKWLVHKGADAWISDRDNRTAISHAAESGLYKVLKMVVDPKALVDPTWINTLNSRSIKECKTALMFAAANGHCSIVKHLLQSRKVDFRCVNDNGDNALMLAAAGGHAGVVGLLAHNCDYYGATNKKGQSVLHIASMLGFHRVIDILLQGIVVSSTSGVDITDGDGCTALHLAAKGGHFQAVQLLLTQRASPDLRNLEGETPLLLSIQAGENYEKTVQLLLSKGCDLSLMTNEKKTALQEAEEKGLLRLRDMLLEEEAHRRKKGSLA